MQQQLTTRIESEFAANHSPGSVHFFIHARFGDAATEILLLAKGVGADLIIVGSHGLIGLDPAAGANEVSELFGQLGGSYYDDVRGGLVRYRARRVGLGAALALVAGAVPGLLGGGGGFLKVPAMNVAMDTRSRWRSRPATS